MSSISASAACSIPLAIAAPAAVSAAAYLNAKFGIGQDVKGLAKFTKFQKQLEALNTTDRANAFYAFEDAAKDPKSANRLFLVLPSDAAAPGQQTQWTYAEAYETMLKYAGWLKDEFSVQPKEVVAMDFTNKPQFIWMWFAIWSLGAIPGFINSNLRDNAFIHCVKISTARLLLIDSSIREVLTDEAKAALGPTDTGRAIDAVIVQEDAHDKIMLLAPYRAPDSLRQGVKYTDTSLLIYTSGTTGLPKAGNVSWGKPWSGYLFWPAFQELTADSRYYSPMPLYHSAASLLCVCACIGARCTYIMGPKFSPRNFMKQVSETKADHCQYIGEICRYLLSTPASPYDRAHNLKVAFGNGLRPDVWDAFKERFAIPTIVEFYGATEAPTATLVQSRNTFTRGTIGNTGLIGRLLSRSTTAIVKYDLETDTPYRSPSTHFCVRAATGEAGEYITWLDPDAIAEKYQGYLGNDSASTSKILRDVFAKGDAWYRTGDLLRRDADGRLYFTDRIGDTFRWKSENVSTAEVAEALSTHPAVKEANVYGVSLPHHDGRAGCAALLLNDGHSLDNASTAASLANHVRQKLPKYAVPLFLRLVKGEFEITGTVKQTKVGLRNQGVEIEKMGGDRLFWLPTVGAEAYETFAEKQWGNLSGGGVRL
nr:hypothetical protein B0A51_09497 [Rachicladosporium sp. CCFEE 5018]